MDRRDGENRVFTCLVLILLIFLLLAFIGPELGLNLARGEDSKETHTMYTLCMENDYVNIRLKPSVKSEATGYLTCGDPVELDGKERNGFCHIIGMTEYGEGWVYSGYLVSDPPKDMNGAKYQIVSDGRVACRKSISGKRRCWAKNGEVIRVWYWSEEWCLTSKGFVQTRYLEAERNGEQTKQ